LAIGSRRTYNVLMKSARCMAMMMMMLTLAVSVQGPAIAAPGADLDSVDLNLHLPGVGPQPEQPAEPEPRLEMTHLSVTTTVMLNNNQVRHNLNLRGELHLPPDTDIVATARQIQLTALIDENGHDLLTDPVPNGNGPIGMIIAGGQNMMALGAMRRAGNTLDHLSVMANLPQLARLPDRLKVMRGYTTVLRMQKQHVQRFEPVRPGGLVRVTDDLAVQIDKVRHDNNQIEIEINFESGEQTPFFNAGAEAFINAIQLVDDHGDTVPFGGWSIRGRGNRDNLQLGTGSVKFTLSPDRKPAALELVVITRTREQRVEFELTDVSLQPEANQPNE
jgi:hypothetical protein